MGSQTNEIRRLAAIMFTDMVGYSALSQRDETRALALLEEQKRIVRSAIVPFEGREIELIGDAFFIEFSSSVEAARCAVEIQRQLHERNAGAGAGNEIVVRIGLHVGDVVHVGEKVHGDGVNIAARIQQAARPGGISLSEDVARQVRNKIDLPIIHLGRGELKNIRLPVEIYCVALPWDGRSAPVSDRIKFVFAKKKTRRILIGAGFAMLIAAGLFFSGIREPALGANSKRIAVIPFLNISPDQSDAYIADGMTEELISNLSKIRDLSVIARTSVFKYKNVPLDVTQIAEELNVGTILTGSVRRDVNKARISVYLTDVSTQKNIWSDDYDRDLKDVFAVQNDISMRVAKMLKLALLAPEKDRISYRGSVDPEAYRLYQLGRGLYNKRTEASVGEAIGHFDRSIESDPGFALAHAGLADCYTLVGGAGYDVGIPRDTAIARAIAAAERAIELDPTLGEAHATLAYVRFRLEWKFAEAEDGFKQAIELNPGLAKAHEWYGLYLAIMRRFDDAIASMRRAEALDPLSSSVSIGLGRTYFFAHKDDSAKKQFEKVIQRDSRYPESYFAMGGVLLRQQKPDSAIRLLERAVELSGGRSIIIAGLGSIYASVGRAREAEEILEKFLHPKDGSKPLRYHAAMVLEGLGRGDEAYEQLLKAYEEREGLLVYLSVEPSSLFRIGDPRIVTILDKMGLPH